MNGFDWLSGMGVSGFSGWFRNTYKDAFSLVRSRKPFDEVYVDMNSLLHSTKRQVNSELQLFRAVDRSLSQLLREVHPSSKVYFALDGPASLSKLPEQRKRRLKNSRSFQTHASGIDSQSFTPGCLFMTRFEAKLMDFAERFMASKSSDMEFLISPAACPGEGEHKIFSAIRSSVTDTLKSRSVVASDSDSYLFAICHGIPKLNISHPTWEMQSPKKEFMSDLMRQILMTESGLQCERQTVHDFALIVQFSGNDYLPGMQFASTAQFWNVYCRPENRDLKLYDLPKNRINLEDLKTFLGRLYKDHFPVSLIGLQNTCIERSQKDPVKSHSRIVTYLQSLTAAVHQVTGHFDANIDYIHNCDFAPSLGEISLMDVSSVEKEIGLKNDIERPVMLPGTAALLMMDLHSQSMPLLPQPALQVYSNYVEASKTEEMNDLQAMNWINNSFEALEKDQLSRMDFKSIFIRDCLSLQKGENLWSDKTPVGQSKTFIVKEHINVLTDTKVQEVKNIIENLGDDWDYSPLNNRATFKDTAGPKVTSPPINNGVKSISIASFKARTPFDHSGVNALQPQIRKEITTSSQDPLPNKVKSIATYSQRRRVEIV